MLTSGVAYKNTSLLQHSIFWGELSLHNSCFYNIEANLAFEIYSIFQFRGHELKRTSVKSCKSL